MNFDTSPHLILIITYEVDKIISSLQMRKWGLEKLRNLPRPHSYEVEEPGFELGSE